METILFAYILTLLIQYVHVKHVKRNNGIETKLFLKVVCLNLFCLKITENSTFVIQIITCKHHNGVDLSVQLTNVRGLGDRAKRREIFHYIHKKDFDITFLQETHSVSKTNYLWSNECGRGEFLFCRW